MTHTYNITGMTCNGCVAKAKSELLKIGDITGADVKLTAPQATLTMQRHIPVGTLQSALDRAGNYVITEEEAAMQHTNAKEETTSWITTYKPILLIGVYISVITLSVQFAAGFFDWNVWMRHCMAAFFLVFSFFKLLDVKAFAESYSTYDILAKRWFGWGYVYPFVELALGITYLLNVEPLLTNAITFVVMAVSLVGVVESVRNKRKIQCACLGAVFNLPMSTITIIEDGVMIIMSATMILIH